MTDRLVHIIDDDEALRESLVFLLESAGVSVVAHESAAAFIAVLPRGGVGCVVTDIRMPGMSGLDLVRWLSSNGYSTPVIVMTGHGDIPLAVEAMKAGVVDFIEKPFDDELLLTAIRVALAEQADNEARDAERHDIESRLESLSPRERDVLHGIVAGRANKVIAADLDISPRTVEVYRANLMTKMRAATLSELVRMALIAGL